VTISPPSSRSAGALPTIPAGKYLQPLGTNGTYNPLTLNYEFCQGILLGAQTIAEVGQSVDGTGVACTLRVGIRADEAGLPGAVQVQGTVAVNTSGYKMVAVNYAHPGGVLWLSFCYQGTTAPGVQQINVYAISGAAWPKVTPAVLPGLTWTATQGPAIGFQNAGAGALPATFVNEAVNDFNQPSYVLKGG
jgi:hypothetical protein